VCYLVSSTAVHSHTDRPSSLSFTPPHTHTSLSRKVRDKPHAHPHARRRKVGAEERSTTKRSSHISSTQDPLVQRFFEFLSGALRARRVYVVAPLFSRPAAGETAVYYCCCVVAHLPLSPRRPGRRGKIQRQTAAALNRILLQRALLSTQQLQQYLRIASGQSRRQVLIRFRVETGHKDGWEPELQQRGGRTVVAAEAGKERMHRS